MAKYVLTWKYALTSAQENHQSVKKLLPTFAKWQQPTDQDWQQLVQRVDFQGGYAIIETDNPAGLHAEVAKFMTWSEFEVIPVVDIADSVPLMQGGVEYRESI
jgi:hypothetical protein